MTRFAHALLGILPAWRRLCHRDLSLWSYFMRRYRLERLDALRAELRCRVCDLRARCRGRIARGLVRPAAGCPNARMFADRA
jgi:hypothetical protein